MRLSSSCALSNDERLEEVRVTLGSCTWFNEPVIEALRLLGPGLEAAFGGGS